MKIARQRKLVFSIRTNRGNISKTGMNKLFSLKSEGRKYTQVSISRKQYTTILLQLKLTSGLFM